MNLHLKLACAALAMALCSAAAQATTYVRNFTLSGATEDPANTSLASGSGSFILDTSVHAFGISLSFANLEGPSAAAHIHCCTSAPSMGNAGVATQTPTFADFPTGVNSGSYYHIFNTSQDSTWNAAFIAANGGTALGAEAALVQGLLNGTAYMNIHSAAYTGGEIRGFLLPVPEPAGWTLMVLGAAGILLMQRKLEDPLFEV
ncbi:CHRD domain-containing protein [Oxalobacteraceae bacterium]|nr:CHRD domain-containing protein [Oxalobacteraceae bacterium]